MISPKIFKLKKLCFSILETTKKLNKKKALRRIRKLIKNKSFFSLERKKNKFLNFIDSSNVKNGVYKKALIFNERLPKRKFKFSSKQRLKKKILLNVDNLVVSLNNRRILRRYRRKRRLKKRRVLKRYAKFKRIPKLLYKDNPLNRYYRGNLELLSLNYTTLLGFQTAIGNSTKNWINPAVFSNILAIRNNMILYDLNSIFISLRKGIQTIFQISKLRGSVLGFADLDTNYKYSGIGFDHFLRSWLPGYLTNYKRVMKNLMGLVSKNYFNLTRRQQKFLANIYMRRLPHRKVRYYYFKFKKVYRKKKKKLKKRIPAVPEFGFCLEDNSIWLNECNRLGLRTLAICDSESFPQKLDYPLVANQKSLPFCFFIVKIVSESIYCGKRYDYFSFVGFNYISKFLHNYPNKNFPNKKP